MDPRASSVSRSCLSMRGQIHRKVRQRAHPALSVAAITLTHTFFAFVENDRFETSIMKEGNSQSSCQLLLIPSDPS
jgi:hypothetical protein